jgi:hypothetical protein
MKKLLVSISVFALAGCSFFGGKKVLSDGEVPTAENFATATEDLQKKLTEKISKLIPVFRVPPKSETDFNLTGNFVAPGLGEISARVESSGKLDASDPSNLKSDGSFVATGKISPSEDSGEIPAGEVFVKVLSKMIGDEVFYQIPTFELKIPQVSSEIVDALSAPFLKKWFGGKLSDFENVLRENDLPVGNLNGWAKNFAGDFLQIREPLTEVLAASEIWKMQNPLPTANGKLQFEVAADPEKLSASAQNLTAFLERFATEKLALPPENLTEMKTGLSVLQNSLTNLPLVGTLQIGQTDALDFSFSGKVGENPLEIIFNESATKISGGPAGAQFQFSAVKKDGATQFTLKVGGAEVARGSKSSDNFSLEVLDNGEKNFAIDLQKNGDGFSGTAKFAAVKIQIENLQFSSEPNGEFNFQLKVAGGGSDAEMNFSATEISEVQISRPEAVETFANLAEKIKTLFFAGADLNPEKSDSEEEKAE